MSETSSGTRHQHRKQGSMQTCCGVGHNARHLAMKEADFGSKSSKEQLPFWTVYVPPLLPPLQHCWPCHPANAGSFGFVHHNHEQMLQQHNLAQPGTCDSGSKQKALSGKNPCLAWCFLSRNFLCKYSNTTSWTYKKVLHCTRIPCLWFPTIGMTWLCEADDYANMM